MNFENVKTTITAYPTLYSDILTGYVPEAPSDGKTYARKDAKWVEIRPADIHFYYGTTDTYSISAKDFLLFKKYTPDLEFKDQSIDIKVQTYSPTEGGDTAGGSFIWFCATSPISNITQKDIGNWPIDYQLQDGVITLDNNQYYCYRTTTALLANIWELTVTFDIEMDKRGKCR